MMPADFPAFFEAASESYANDNVASGRWNKADASTLAREETKRLLPQDERTPDNCLFVLLETERRAEIGYLWYGTMTRGTRKVAFLFQLYVRKQYRRQGYGLQAMHAFELEAMRTGHHSLALNVFASNPGALKLYESVGYSPTSIGMRKELSRDDA
jgi:GNAT superfamily N-acetyltransferase